MPTTVTLDDALKLADQDCPLPALGGKALRVLRARIRELEGQPAARVDEGMVREVIAELRLDAPMRPSAHYLADKLEVALSAQPAPERQGEGWLPETGAYLIRYDDTEQEDELFVGQGARGAAQGRYEQISGNWNAHLFVKIDSNSRDCNTPNATTHPAAPVGVPDVRVDKQGVRFGDGCWYSHERITGVGADLLNEGKCSITAREYMKWVQKHLAAAPSAPQGKG